MEHPNGPPSADEALGELAAVFPAIYQALQIGTDQARAHVASFKLPYDAAVHAGLVRLHAKRALLDLAEPLSFQLPDLPFAGLHLVAGRYQIKILKNDEGDLPPVHSARRRDFYEQLVLFPELAGYQSDNCNLVVVWEVDDLRNLKSVTVVCPRGDPSSFSLEEQYWAVPLAAPPGGIEAPVEDLPITWKEAQNGEANAQA